MVRLANQSSLGEGGSRRGGKGGRKEGVREEIGEKRRSERAELEGELGRREAALVMERYGKEEKREERCRRKGRKTGITQIQGGEKGGREKR